MVRQDLIWCDDCQDVLHMKHSCYWTQKNIGFTGIERFKYLREHHSSEKSYRDDNLSEHRRAAMPKRVQRDLRNKGAKGLG